MPDAANANKSPQPNRLDPSEIVGESAIAHVGPTLESDPEFNDIENKDHASPEGQLAGESGSCEVDPRAIVEDVLDASTGPRAEAPRTGRRPEPLITHLEGDTSSDPHTDVGPDNATTVQHRGEGKPRTDH